jgi:hypothetical protein
VVQTCLSCMIMSVLRCTDMCQVPGLRGLEAPGTQSCSLKDCYAYLLLSASQSMAAKCPSLATELRMVKQKRRCHVQACSSIWCCLSMMRPSGWSIGSRKVRPCLPKGPVGATKLVRVAALLEVVLLMLSGVFEALENQNLKVSLSIESLI